MMTLVMSHFNFLASKYFVRPAASLSEKLSIFINFDIGPYGDKDPGHV